MELVLIYIRAKFFGNINLFIFYYQHLIYEIFKLIYFIKKFSLLGHNGSGKTTTISLLTGMLSKNKGSIKGNYIYVNKINLDIHFNSFNDNII